MEVLLIQDVDNLGYAGDVKQVKNGFGRNYLFPQRLAVLATPGALKQSETIRKSAEKLRAQELEDAKAIANQIADLKLVFERRAGETGKLYGSVTSAEIVNAIEDKTGISIDKRKIFLPEPIRLLGEHAVTIKIVMDLSIQIQVEVLPEGGIAERARFLAKQAAEEQAKQELKEKLEAEKAEAEKAEVAVAESAEIADDEANDEANQASEQPESVEEASSEESE